MLRLRPENGHSGKAQQFTGGFDNVAEHVGSSEVLDAWEGSGWGGDLI